MSRNLCAAVAGLLLLVMPAAGHADPATDRKQQLADAWREFESVVERYNAVQDDLRGTDAQLERVSTQLAALQPQVDAAQVETDELAATLYRNGDVGSTAVLLSADSPEMLMDQLATLDHLGRQHGHTLAQLRRDRTSVEQEHDQLSRLQTRQRTQQQDLAQRKSTIESQLKQLKQVKQVTTYPDPVTSTPSGAVHDGYVPQFSSDAAGTAVRFAYSQLGKVYHWGAEGPDAFDCSGLTMAAWKAGGVELPHNAARQKKTVEPITRDQLRPGDLVFYYRNVSHVGMYVGNGRVVEAPKEGERISMRLIDYAPIAGYGRPQY